MEGAYAFGLGTFRLNFQRHLARRLAPNKAQAAAASQRLLSVGKGLFADKRTGCKGKK